MDITPFINNNNENITLGSDIPDVMLTEECMIGIDEAGRGPVLGPMVYGAAFCPISHHDKLKDLGFADSKTLSEDERDKLLGLVEENASYIGWAIELLSPTRISNAMLATSKYSLNALSHDSAIGLIQRVLDQGVNIREVYVDTVGPPEKYQAKLSAIFPGIKITVAKKADSLFPIVSCASICAKVARDRAVKSWKLIEGEVINTIEYGSGYPGDPATKKFLLNSMDTVFGFPSVVRFSWQTAEKALEGKVADVQWDNNNMEAIEEHQSVMDGFMKARKPKDLSFFRNRQLRHTTSV